MHRSLLEELAEHAEEYESINKSAGIRIELKVDPETECVLLSSGRIKLIYDPARFERDPEEYIAEQLEAHQGLEQEVREFYFKSQEGLYKTIRSQMDAERLFQFLSKRGHIIASFLVRVLVFPTLILSGYWSAKGFIEQTKKNNESRIKGYNIIKRFTDYGASFFEMLLEQCEPSLSMEVTRCISSAKQLSWTYSKLSTDAQKMVESSLDFQNLLYPETQQ